MITYKTGNLLDASTEAIVNAVNTVGVMGKGIALQFKEQFPANFKLYQKACQRHEVVPGKMFVTETGQLINPRLIINFPTKTDWRKPSRIEYIEAGLDDLVKIIEERHFKSIALPPLGCGNGGLDWKDVRPLIVSALADLPVETLIFEPSAVVKEVFTK